MPADTSDEQAGSLYDAPTKGVLAVVVAGLSLFLAAFHVYTAYFGPFYALTQRAIHVGIGIAIVFLMIAPGASKRKSGLFAADAIAALVTLAITAYVVYNKYRILREVGYADPTDADVMLGYVMIALLIEASRRVIGWEFALLCVATLVYGAVGPWLPGMLEHQGFKPETLITTAFLNPMGIYGTMTAVSATTIAVYVLFGSLLLVTGGANAFLKLALLVAGRVRGGAAQVAVIGSGIMGMVNGSAVANVATVGTMTIPLMKSQGYPAYFAAAVEAAASSGGQIMPPIMGAGAFVMAEILGIPYMKVAVMAIIPALMYYAIISATIYFEARKRNLVALDRAMLPRLSDMWRDMVVFIVPVIFLFILLLLAYTPRYAGFWAIAGCVTVFVVARLLIDRDGSLGSRARDAVRIVLDGSRQGAQTIATIGVMVAGSQIIVAVIGLTGVGVTASELIFTVAQGNVVLGFALAGVVNLLLGLSLPTVPSYIITVAVVGPALVKMGIDPVVVHMFSFFLACMSGLTPPVAATSFVAAQLAHAGVWKTSWCSCRIAIGGYLVPAIFAFHPQILGIGAPIDVAAATALGLVGCIVIAAGFTRYWLWPISIWQSAFAVVGGALFMVPGAAYQVAGGILSLIGLSASYASRSKTARAPAGSDA